MNKLFALLFAVILTVSACTSEKPSDADAPGSPVVPDTLYWDSFKEIISTESGLLAMPYGLVPVEGSAFAVLDYGLNRVLVFDYDGNEVNAFGGSGGGPGEWDGYPSGLNYKDGVFMVFNSGRIMFNLYDKSGGFMFSVPASRYMTISNFRLMPGKRLLVSTNGRDDALAVVIDLQDEGKTIKRIGTPDSETADIRDIESERQSLADGIIPPFAKNTALVEYDDDGYWLFMNGLGELRHYTNEGDLATRFGIPEDIKKPVFEHVVKMNRENPRPHTVFTLKYAVNFLKHGDKLFVLTRPYMDRGDLHQHLLVYTTQGKLYRHYVLEKDEMESVLFDFFLTGDNMLIGLDVSNARVLKISL